MNILFTLGWISCPKLNRRILSTHKSQHSANWYKCFKSGFFMIWIRRPVLIVHQRDSHLSPESFHTPKRKRMWVSYSEWRRFNQNPISFSFPFSTSRYRNQLVHKLTIANWTYRANSLKKPTLTQLGILAKAYVPNVYLSIRKSSRLSYVTIWKSNRTECRLRGTSAWWTVWSVNAQPVKIRPY